MQRRPVLSAVISRRGPDTNEMDVMGFEPEAFCMQSRRDTTTPQARRRFGIRFAVRIFPIIKVPVDPKLTAVGFEPTPFRTSA